MDMYRMDTDWRTDRPTNGRTDIVAYRVACTRLKRWNLSFCKSHNVILPFIPMNVTASERNWKWSKVAQFPTTRNGSRVEQQMRPPPLCGDKSDCLIRIFRSLEEKENSESWEKWSQVRAKYGLPWELYKEMIWIFKHPPVKTRTFYAQ